MLCLLVSAAGGRKEEQERGGGEGERREMRWVFISGRDEGILWLVDSLNYFVWIYTTTFWFGVGWFDMLGDATSCFLP